MSKIITTILRDFCIQTDRRIKSNGVGIMVKNYKRKTCFLIGISVTIDQ